MSLKNLPLFYGNYIKILEITHKHTWNPRRWSFFLPFYRRVAQRLLLLGQQVDIPQRTDHTQTEWTHLHQTAKANQVRFLFQGMWFTGAFPSQVSGESTLFYKMLLCNIPWGCWATLWHVKYDWSKSNLHIKCYARQVTCCFSLTLSFPQMP